MTHSMLSVRNLHVSREGTPILRGINLEVKAGEVHAIMGPNGSGKSTLSHVVAGKPGYEITEGEILFNGEPLADTTPDVRARAGIFLAFQYPVEIPGVNNAYFLKAALNARRKQDGEEELDAVDFLALVRSKMKTLQMDAKFLQRPVNEGFSGGEKKRNEILQMAILEPSLCLLDETDSGLDIDALRVVAQGVNALRTPTRGMVLVTHYQRLLDYIVPDVVHVLAGGRIVRSGGPELAHELEASGYADIAEHEAPSKTHVAKGARAPAGAATASAGSSRAQTRGVSP